MTSGIPVVIHLDRDTFRALETIAQRNGTRIATLIENHTARSLERTSSPGRGRPRATHPVADWIDAARMGVTNRVIAERYGVSEQVVSRALTANGVHRRRRISRPEVEHVS